MILENMSARAKVNAGIAVIAAAVLCWTALAGWLVMPDTALYLDNSGLRPPVYPLLLGLFRACFGPGYYTQVMIFQTCMVLLAAYYAAAVLRDQFSLPGWAVMLLYFMLITPLLPAKSLYAATYGPVGRLILTEALTYAVFITAFGLLVQAVFSSRKRYFALFIALSVATTLLRAQMAFMYPAAALMIYYSHRKFGKVRVTAGLVGVFLLSLVFSGLAKRAFLPEAASRNFSAQSPAEILAAPVLFLSNRADLDAFSPGPDKEFLRGVFDRLEAEKLTAQYRFETGDLVQVFYSKNINGLYNALGATFTKYYGGEAGKPGGRSPQDLNSICRRVVPALVRLHLTACVRFWGGMFLYDLNFREGFFLALLLVVLLRRGGTAVKTVMLLGAALALSNRVMLAFMFGNDRYLFYTNTVEQVMAAIVLLLLYREARDGAFPGALSANLDDRGITGER